MTLFHLREFWSTNCGSEEEFDTTSLSISNVDNCSDGFDKVVVASINGILRVYKVELAASNKNEQNHFQASDLLLEVDFKLPILQIASGILLSSSNVQLAVLHPTKLCVYSISSSSGITEHGTSYNILLIYEHNFEFKAINMLLGPFGQIKGKDIICVQDVNSRLNFYENESFSFSYKWTKSSVRTFPLQLAYIPNRDVIVVVDNLYQIECYRYQELAMDNLNSSRDEDDTKGTIIAEWSYSLGELVLDIQTVLLDKWYLVILGERNLVVLRDNGTLWFSKKFDISPSCLCVFSNDNKDSMVTIVGTHMQNLLIYQNEALKWATKVPFVPLCIKRAHFNDIPGAITLLSDKGHLAVGYLGTNPSLKIIAMPTINDHESVESMEQELKEFKKIASLENTRNSEQENKYATYLDVRLAQLDNRITNYADTFQISIEVITMRRLKHVKVYFFHNDFYQIVPSEFELETIDTSAMLEAQLTIKRPSPLSRKIKCYFVFQQDTSIRTVPKSVELPFDCLSKRSVSLKNPKYMLKITYQKALDSKAELGSLFADLNGNSEATSAVSFVFRANEQCQASVKTTDDSVTHQIESNNIVTLYWATKELTHRMHCKSINFKVSSLLLNFNLIDSLCGTVEERIKAKNALQKHKNELAKFSQHYRLLQKRILIKLKDKTPTSLDNLEKIMNLVQMKMNKHIEDTLAITNILNNHTYYVWTHLKLLKNILKLGEKQESKELTKFIKIISISQMANFGAQWEELLEFGLLEIFEGNKDINNLTKMIDYEQNNMRNGQTLAATFTKVFKHLCDNYLCPIQIL